MGVGLGVGGGSLGCGGGQLLTLTQSLAKFIPKGMVGNNGG